MRTLIVALGVALTASLGLAAGGVLGSGEDDAAGGWTDGGKQALVAGANQATAAGVTTAAKRRGPAVTHLITSQAIQVQPEGNLFVKLRCSKKQGVPVGGGFVLAAGSELVPAVQSRFNPNDFGKPKRAYFIGVRNDSASEVGTFRGTLTCMKGIKEKG